MKSNEIDERKTKYFVIAILILIVLSIILVIHFNNKSLVSGEKDKTTKTTTTELITTKKKTTRKRTTTQAVVDEVVADSTIYKSTIDEETKIVYNYKLTDEILDTDKIISKVLMVDETLKSNNVIGLYDISLYDVNNIKKTVTNSSIEISIPLSKDLLGYDEYKIIYIDDNNKISEEKFESVVENNYIKFTTTHLSKFGIVATKKEVIEEPKEEVEENIDLSNVKIDLKINDEVVTKNNLYVKTKDSVDLNINGLEKDTEYKLYYLLQNEEVLGEYKEFTNEMLKDIKTPSTYKLIIKLVVGEEYKTFELATLNIYDEVFVYDKNEELTEDKVIGEIKDEDGVESTYKEKDNNMNIVIDNVTVEEEIEELPEVDNSESEEVNINNELNDSIVEQIPSDENTELETPEEDLAKIILKGNVYLVEETDISELDMTGHLIIDTKENIRMNGENKSFDLSNLYTIYIKSEYFSIDGVNYKYEIKDGLIVITKLAELESDNEVVTKEAFESLFNGFEYNENHNELLLSKKEEQIKNETNNNTEELPENESETNQEEAITK